MTREEEIELVWLSKAVQSNHRYDEKSFKEGAEWADEHPKEGLVSIDKVIQHLKNNIDMYTQTKYSIRSGYEETYLIDSFETDFRKAMEG